MGGLIGDWEGEHPSNTLHCMQNVTAHSRLAYQLHIISTIINTNLLRSRSLEHAHQLFAHNCSHSTVLIHLSCMSPKYHVERATYYISAGRYTKVFSSRHAANRHDVRQFSVGSFVGRSVGYRDPVSGQTRRPSPCRPIQAVP